MFDFLGTDELRRESELEQKLMDHLEKFLMELGQGFAFVGRQVHMEVGKDDCYIDRIRDDIEGLTMDAESIFELTEKEQAKKLNLSLMGKIREKSDPRFDGWQNSITGERDIQKVLRQTLFRYKLHTEQALFEKAYAYIREHY